MRNLILFLSLCFGISLGASYHFASSGDDSRTALLAQNAATPWQSLSKLSSVTLAAGDSILLSKGDTLRGQITITASGTTAKPIVVASYGTGSMRPVVLGTEVVTGWSQNGEIWSATLSASARAGDRMFWNGSPLLAAREPDTGWFSIDTGYGDSAFDAKELSGANWLGAVVHVKSASWNIDARTVTAFTGIRASLSSPVNGDLATGWGFFINKSLAALDQPGEWYYDSIAHKVFLIPPTGLDPTNARIEIASQEYGVYAINRSYLVVQDLEFIGQGMDGVRLIGNNSTVQNCSMLNADQRGIYGSGSNIIMRNNTIRGTNAFGIKQYGSKGVIESNHIFFINDFASLGPRGESGECCAGRGIEASGDSLIIRGNTLDSIGYIGIGFLGQGSLIENNVVDHACITSHDCAGIYTWTGKFSTPGSLGSEVRFNIVRNSFGNPQGCPRYTPAGHGIYMDDATHQVWVHDNVVTGNELGIFLHNNRDMVVTHNISFGNRERQISVSRDNIVSDIIYGNRVDSNTLVSLQGVPLRSMDDNSGQDSVLARFHGNIECQDDPFNAQCKRDDVLLWKTNFVDAAARTTGATNLLRNGTFESGASGWYTWPDQVTLAITTDSCRTSKCLSISQVAGMNGNSGLATDGDGHNVLAGEMYLLDFWAKNCKVGTLTAVLRQNHDPYNTLANEVKVDGTTAWTHYSIPLRITASDTSARVDFLIEEGEGSYVLDDVSWKKMDDSGIDSTAHAMLFVSTTSGGTHVLDFEKLWRLPIGTQVLSLDLAPFSGGVVFQDSTVLTNLPIAIHVTSPKHAAAPSNTHLVFHDGNLWVEIGDRNTANFRTVRISGRTR